MARERLTDKLLRLAEENEAEWEAQWQRLHRYKARCSSGPLRTELDDIWKSFKNVSNGGK